jgi:hypothetical protein
MKKFFLFLILLPGTLLAADTAILRWTLPTENTNNEPLTGDNAITSNKVLFHPSEITPTTEGVGEVVVGPDAVTHTLNLSGGANGQLYYFRVQSCNAAGCSAMSAQVSKFISADISPPKAPSGLIVEDTVAYTVVKALDKFVMLPVGTVPASTPCITDQMVNGYYVVPRSAVTWSGNVRPDVVVAKCVSSGTG